MNQKIDKKELKNPDLIQGELQKGFQWTTSHSKMVLGLIGLVIVVWAGILTQEHFALKKEEQVQASFFKAEKAFIEKKEKFEQALAEEKMPAKDPKKKDVESEKEKMEKASGDLNKDFGPQMDEFAKIINENPNTNAAQMAAIHYAGAHLDYNKAAEAEAMLKKVNADQKSILSALVLKQLGTAQANQNKCQDAIQTWNKILMNANAKALHTEVKLSEGLCYEALNDTANAEKMYAQAKIPEATFSSKEEEKLYAEGKIKLNPTAANKTAEKYLKLLQMNKR